MPDHAPTSGDSANWAVIVPDLLAHIVDQLDASLPVGLALLATPHITLLTTNGKPRVVATQAPRIPPAATRKDLADVAAYILGDIQDLVIGHLATPWPLTEAGLGTHPVAEFVGTSLKMRFSARNETEEESVYLQPYSVPQDPPETVSAG